MESVDLSRGSETFSSKADEANDKPKQSEGDQDLEEEEYVVPYIELDRPLGHGLVRIGKSFTFQEDMYSLMFIA